MVTACRFVNSWAYIPSVEAFCLHIQQKICLKFVFLHEDGGRKLVFTVDNYINHTVSYLRRIEPSFLISPKRPLRHLYKNYTRRFIMFSVITNIYNKKAKGPTLMELFTATGKLKKFFFTTRDVRWVHHRWHGTHRYDIKVVATNASTYWRVCGKNLNIVSMCAVSPVVHTSDISSCQKKLFQFSCGCEQFH